MNKDARCRIPGSCRSIIHGPFRRWRIQLPWLLLLGPVVSWRLLSCVTLNWLPVATHSLSPGHIQRLVGCLIIRWVCVWACAVRDKSDIGGCCLHAGWLNQVGVNYPLTTFTWLPIFAVEYIWGSHLVICCCCCYSPLFITVHSIYY